MPFTRSLRAKLALLISFLIGVVSLVVYFYVPPRLQEQTLRSVAEEAYNITDMAAYSVAPGLRAGDRSEVFRETQRRETASDTRPVREAAGVRLSPQRKIVGCPTVHS